MEQSVCNKSGDKSGEIPLSRPMVHEIFDNFLPFFSLWTMHKVADFQKDFSPDFFSPLKFKIVVCSKNIPVLHVCTRLLFT